MDSKGTDSGNSDGYIYEMGNNSDSSCGGSFDLVSSEESYDRMTDFEEHLSKISSGAADMAYEIDGEIFTNMEESSGWETNLNIEEDQDTCDADNSTGYGDSEMQFNDPKSQEDQDTSDADNSTECGDSEMQFNNPKSQDSPAYFQTRFFEYPLKFKRKEEMELKDIIGENALRFLPAKSVLRFRSVSREWYDKISRPLFPFHQSSSFRSTSGYFTKNNPSSFVSLNSSSYGCPSPALNFLPEPVSVLSSSNGLVLCQGKNLTYYVCNPATCQFQLLPAPKFYHGESSKAAIAFEPSDDLYFETVYFIICPFTPSEADVTYFEIYSSITKTWRLWDTYDVFLSTNIKDNGFYANGMVFWEMDPVGWATDPVGSVLVFDMKFELCSVEMFRIGRSRVLCFVEGDLCYVTARVNSNMCSVFVRKAVDMSLKMPVVRVEVPLQLMGKGVGPCRVLPPCGNDDTFCCVVGNGAFGFSLKDGKANLVTLDGIESSDVFVPYVNSLVPLRGSS